MKTNINPIYVQEVSREYYDKVLDNSRQHKAAARLTKKWLEKNPNVSNTKKIGKFGDIVEKIHKRYDKVRNRNDLDTRARNLYIGDSLLSNILTKDQKDRSRAKDSAYELFKSARKAHSGVKQIQRFNKALNIKHVKNQNDLEDLFARIRKFY